MTDLVCLVADKNMNAAVSGLLDRPHALGIRRITKEILVHQEKDSGCCYYPMKVLRAYRNRARHALIVLDLDWDGAPRTSGAELETFIEQRLEREGMERWAVPVVIEPELEAWVFSDSPHVDEVLGWTGRDPALRDVLEQRKLWLPKEPKPADPKAALKWALKAARKRPLSSVYFRELARKVSTKNCRDRAFLRFRQLLQGWFPRYSSSHGNPGAHASSRGGANVVQHGTRIRKKLIEVALPLDAINAASAREKSIRHGHPSTLHLWWARRPLAAARAVIFAQMVDDPSAHPDRFPTAESQEEERERLFRIIRELVQWENTNNEEVLERAREEIRASWHRTCFENADHPRAAELFDPDRLPAFHDPFAGGGSLPLEAQRLGLEANASDLNPVAVLINKAMIEIPPKFAGRPPVNPAARADATLVGKTWRGAQGLAEDVRHYGRWMRDEAEKRIGHLYPPVEITPEMVRERPDLKPYEGRKLTVIAWLWARTVKSPNPAFGDVDVPLASSFVLSKKRGNEALVEPVIEDNHYHFVVRAKEEAESMKAWIHGTKSSRGVFRCLMSGTPIVGNYIKAEARSGRMGSRLMAIVAEGKNERVFLSPTKSQEADACKASPAWAPDFEFFQHALGFRVANYGMTKWNDLFTKRQIDALTTFTHVVSRVHELVERDAKKGFSETGDDVADSRRATEYSDAVVTYLALSVSKSADLASTICHWQANSQHLKIAPTYARNALPMSWDYSEGNPFSRSSGNFWRQIELISRVIEGLLVPGLPGTARQADAASLIFPHSAQLISTDPPYFDNIGYADMSDFFYVWLRRSLKTIYSSLFSTLMVPKTAELVATPARHNGRKNAEAFFLRGMKRVMQTISAGVHSAFPLTVYYAFKQSEHDDDEGSVSTGWETFLEALIQAGLAMSGTWPVRTERPGRMRDFGSNALASSIVLVCRRRSPDAPPTSRREFLAALRSELPPALAELQKSNIAPVDLQQAAIGPGMAIFTRYSRVLESDGSPMTVRAALIEINRMLDETLARQEGDLDADTRFCVAWYEQYGLAERAYGEAEVLFSAKNTSFEGLRRAGVVAGGKGKVRLRRRDELEPDWDPAADRRVTDWEGAQHLTRALTDERGGGVTEAARLVLGMGAHRAQNARALAYRLYTLADRQRWTDEARAYNVLVTSWPQIQAETARLRAGVAEQAGLGLSARDGA